MDHRRATARDVILQYVCQMRKAARQWTWISPSRSDRGGIRNPEKRLIQHGAKPDRQLAIASH